MTNTRERKHSPPCLHCMRIRPKVNSNVAKSLIEISPKAYSLSSGEYYAQLHCLWLIVDSRLHHDIACGLRQLQPCNPSIVTVKDNALSQLRLRTAHCPISNTPCISIFIRKEITKAHAQWQTSQVGIYSNFTYPMRTHHATLLIVCT